MSAGYMIALPDVRSDRRRTAVMRTTDTSTLDDTNRTETTSGDSIVQDLEIAITAGEAYPKLEQAFLNAKQEISCSFRVFDFCTRLRSEDARKIGETWFDLMEHTLDRGIKVRLVISDFDPVAAPNLHQNTWRTCRQVAALQELSDSAHNLTYIGALHNAAIGPFPRLLFAPLVRRKLSEIRQLWNNMTHPQRSRFRDETPRLRDIIHPEKDGELRMFPRRVTLVPATHHQKIAVFDRRYVSIGGLDVNERRYDTRSHDRAAERTWHDVQAFATGPIAETVARHLDTFLDNVAGETSPKPRADNFLRTISKVRLRNLWRVAPETLVDELCQQHLDNIAKAENFIYLETQFLRHVPIARALARRAGECPSLRILLVLPAAPEDVAFSGNWGLDARYGEALQTRCVSILSRGFGRHRMAIASPVQPRPDHEDHDGRATLRQAPLIYVHSKVSIFDDTRGIVSSGNLNGRSMKWDTEAGLHLTDPDQVAHLRSRVMGHWLPKDLANRDRFFDTKQGFESWKTLIEGNSNLPPKSRRGFLVSYDSDAARDAAVTVPGLPEEAV